MADDTLPSYDQKSDESGTKVKVICLGDSAVGKSKLVERFLMDGYQPQQLSTYALTLFKYKTSIGDLEVHVDFWDTAGQERFSSMHPSYYHQAHACILVFDITRKVTYKNLPSWYKELRDYRPEIPCLCAANKIDSRRCFEVKIFMSTGQLFAFVDYSVTKKSFNFPKKHKMPFYFVSASDGTNVVKCFRDAIKAAVAYKNNSTDFMDEIMKELENFDLDGVGTSGMDNDTSKSKTRGETAS